MTRFFIREDGKAYEIMVNFEGTITQLAEKVTAKGAVSFSRDIDKRVAPATPKKRKSKSQLRGKLKPFNGQVPASVFTLRLCREPHSLIDISNAWPGSSHTTIASAVSRMLEDLKLDRVPNSNKFETTNAGLKALKEFDAAYPACAENATEH